MTLWYVFVMCNGGYGMTIGLCTCKTWCVMCDVYVFYIIVCACCFTGFERIWLCSGTIAIS